MRGDDPKAFAADPPAGWVVGTLEEAAEQLMALRDAGVSRVMCQQLLHEDLEAVALLAELARLIA
jgi:alkanesulfonate monooxygenase SsuD/methylene tetrahydromethanopterin reductase-like flavin-dependent oxidoreductase (luciferase family)